MAIPAHGIYAGESYRTGEGETFIADSRPVLHGSVFKVKGHIEGTRWGVQFTSNTMGNFPGLTWKS